MQKYFKVGQIVNTQGLKGEMRVYPLTDYKERFEEIQWVYIGDDLQTKYFIEKVRYKNNLAIIKLKGIDNINEVEKLRNKYLVIPRENARELEEDAYFIADLIGLNAYTVDGKYLGVLEDVMQPGANDVYVIKSEDGKEYLIPAVKQFVPEININERKIIIDPIEGMI
ncbi:16S rRNA processing protein RimM [Alkalithermobacter thermoalcaliphilus JW-YL-7 = DSM 7308]|uniref:Ribosome maturation factor RimM n=2 Tax=Clostridium paradoxum TaxID=29346 RepID=A0A150FSQ0_CLOPD|nr:Ribosome maturation factor rimM [[Clostridium] paradoxum JW-YL-7 = DSM 7308]SHL11879.1 16S rRNA processing protein RimM [[Clostridium] paradoxum JW-YL-7 = DSM 7308]